MKNDSPYNDATVLCHDNGGFRSELILLMIFAFAYAVHSGLMDTVDLMGAVFLLIQNPLVASNLIGVL